MNVKWLTLQNCSQVIKITVYTWKENWIWFKVNKNALFCLTDQCKRTNLFGFASHLKEKSLTTNCCFFACVNQNNFSTEHENGIQNLNGSALEPCWKFFFLFYVNRDWWNILHRVQVFDKKYWWLLSVSVTGDDRTLHFKMNYSRNSLFGNVIHFISSVVLRKSD